MPSGSDLAKSSHYRSARLRTLQAELRSSSFNDPASLARQANAEAAAAASLAPPVLPSNAMVITHTGQMVSDFYHNGLFVGAFFDLSPHGVGGHLDERRRKISFQEWSQILLR
ncbi:unnamed protein product [Pylaiella littoralis]